MPKRGKAGPRARRPGTGSSRRTRKPAARRAPRRRTGGKKVARPATDLRSVGAIMHDLTNLATAMRAYLELLETQGPLDARQKYYLERSREQVDALVKTVQDLRSKLPPG